MNSCKSGNTSGTFKEYDKFNPSLKKIFFRGPPCDKRDYMSVQGGHCGNYWLICSAGYFNKKSSTYGDEFFY